MDAIAFIALIAWFVFSAVRKKKKREAAEAAKREAAEQVTGQAAQPVQPAAKPVYSAPVEHPAPVAPKATDFDPFFGGLAELLREQAAPAQAQPAKPAVQSAAKQATPAAPQQRAPMQSRMQSGLSGRTTTMQSTLQSTMRHTLESSYLSGHAHTESSITGVEPECPPENPRVYAAVQATAPKSADRSFHWNADDAMRGIVLSEILGKPKALQR